MEKMVEARLDLPAVYELAAPGLGARPSKAPLCVRRRGREGPPARSRRAYHAAAVPRDAMRSLHGGGGPGEAKGGARTEVRHEGGRA